jgi:predicted ABC-type transport system involved in lysophospholipase L1 biosynthesis ATPase subunit
LNSSKSRAVDQARDHLAHVVGLARVLRHHAVELVGGVQRLGGGSRAPTRDVLH